MTFIAACAMQSGLVTLVSGYGIDVLRPALPVSATLIPPLAWVTFQDAMVIRLSLRAMAVHGAAPAFALFCRIFAPETVDLVVACIFAGYGAAVLLHLRTASDMPLARLEAGRVPATLWQVLGWALIASALSDGLIALAFATGHASWTGWLITIFSSRLLLMLCVLSGSPSATGSTQDEDTAPAPPHPVNEEDTQILNRLETFLTQTPLHLDPNLTLSRLARRLHIPEKRLSAAVNRTTGANVSRYINGWRIRHACAQLEAGASVTDAMFDSGFNTKSNFNRAFLAETGMPPSQWHRSTPALSKAAFGGATSVPPSKADPVTPPQTGRR